MNNEMIEVITAYRCLECEVVSEEHADSPLYECGECGEVFTRDGSADGGSNRCPNDNRFAAKLADLACAECGEGEVEEVQAVLIEDELIVVEGDGTPEELIAQARERHEREEREEREREEARERARAEQAAAFAALPRVRADEVLPGDVLRYPDPTSIWDAYPTFTVGRVEADRFEPGKIALRGPGGMGFGFSCDPGDTFALVERPEQTPENERAIEDILRESVENAPPGFVTGYADFGPKDES